MLRRPPKWAFPLTSRGTLKRGAPFGQKNCPFPVQAKGHLFKVHTRIEGSGFLRMFRILSFWGLFKFPSAESSAPRVRSYGFSLAAAIGCSCPVVKGRSSKPVAFSEFQHESWASVMQDRRRNSWIMASVLSKAVCLQGTARRLD